MSLTERAAKYVEEMKQHEQEKQQALEAMVSIVEPMSVSEFAIFIESIRSDKYSQIPRVESTDSEWTIVDVAEKYGRKISDAELESIDNMFLSEAHEYKGYYFGIMVGQGSAPWYVAIKQ